MIGRVFHEGIYEEDRTRGGQTLSPAPSQGAVVEVRRRARSPGGSS